MILSYLNLAKTEIRHASLLHTKNWKNSSFNIISHFHRPRSERSTIPLTHDSEDSKGFKSHEREISKSGRVERKH